MFRFGIYADRDSLFIGGKPGKWWGIHWDLPWSEDCKNYGAPYALYLHAWPAGATRIPLKRLLGEPKSLFSDPTKWRRVKIKRKCSIQGCTREPAKGSWYEIEQRYRPEGQPKREIMSTHGMLCTKHMNLYATGNLLVRLEEPPKEKTTTPKQTYP